LAKATDSNLIKPPQIRLDKWLWYARQTKTRSLAQKLIAGGNVRLNRDKIISPSKMITHGDVLTLAIANTIRILKVVDCGSRRGPYIEAQKLYEDLSPPVEKTPRLSNAEKGLPTKLARPEGRERMAARRLSGKE